MCMVRARVLAGDTDTTGHTKTPKKEEAELVNGKGRRCGPGLRKKNGQETGLREATMFWSNGQLGGKTAWQIVGGERWQVSLGRDLVRELAWTWASGVAFCSPS